MAAVGCCKGSGSCGCVEQGATDDGCALVTIEVTGAGTTAAPFVITPTAHLSRVFRSDGNEPWVLTTDGDGCDIVAPRCQYDVAPTALMVNAGGSLQGYAFQVFDCELGSAVWKYQALNTDTVQTSLPSGWRPSCGTMVGAAWHPLYTDGDVLTTLAGYAFLRYDIEADVYSQRYVTLAGSTTLTKPGAWEQGACATSSGGGGGGGSGTFPDPLPGSIHLYLQSGTVLDDKKYPDWGLPGLDVSERWDALHLPPGYTGADWTRFVISVGHVTATLTEALTITLKDLTNSVDVATWTWPAGTSPVSSALHADLTISSGSFTDWIKVQWHIVNAEAALASARVHGEAFYEATAGFAS